MSPQRHPTSRPDVTEGWPEHPGNEELARLGNELFGHLPGLPQIALDRIQVRMRQEMNRPWWARRWRTLLGVGVAAVALSIGTWGWLRSTHPRAGTSPSAGATTQPPGVRERFDISLPPTSPKPPERPLIDLRRDQDLFKKERK